MKVPESLKKGDKIGIVCPAKKMGNFDWTFTLQLLESWGLIPVLGKTAQLNHFHFAGTDAARRADLQNMLDDPEIKAILCGRGGYGTVRIVDQLDVRRFWQKPKWIIGYSDVTVLHNHIHSRFQTASVHATMPINFDQNTPEALESLKNVLFGKKNSYNITPHPLNRLGKRKGQVIGGNLSLLYSLIGSISDIDTNFKILLLEEVGEYLYSIDRMMMNLKRSGKLANLKGLIVGGFTHVKDDTDEEQDPFGKTAYEIIAEHTADYDFPIAFNFPAGHWKDNRAVIMGKEATLRVQADKAIFKQGGFFV